MKSSDPEYDTTFSLGRLVAWCTFGNDALYEPKYVAQNLAFDPSAAVHHYKLDVYEESDEASRVSTAFQTLFLLTLFVVVSLSLGWCIQEGRRDVGTNACRDC